MQSIVMQANNGFNPMAISPPPSLFLNPYRDAYVSTIDNNGLRQRGNIIDSATATTGQALATAGTLASKAIFNGEGWYFQAGAQMTTGSTSDYNFIHDGSDFDIWCAVFICPTTTTTYLRGILSNNGLSNSARGFQLTINSSNNNRLEFRACNGTVAFISLSANSAVTVNATNIIRVRRSGTSALMFVNGVQVATQTISASPGVGNANNVLAIVPSIAVSANLYLKDVVIFNRVLTAPEAVSMNTRKFAAITPGPMNVYFQGGDSNSAGRGLNSAIASDLIGAIPGAYAARFSSNTPDTTTWIGRLQTAVNNTLISENIATDHGVEMRFGKSMGAVKDCFILKYGRGSTPLYQNTALGDWNVASGPSYAYDQFIANAVPQALSDLVHVYRRTPVFRGMIWIHGGNDTPIGGNGTWTRSGTTITVTKSFHGMSTGHKVMFTTSSDLTTIPAAIYTVTKIDNNTFTIVGVNTGATSGTLTYSAGATYKANLTNLINGIVTYLGSTIKNQVTNGTGYTVNKLRIFIAKPYTGANNNDPGSFAAVIAAQDDLPINYLTENPSYVGKVLSIYAQNIDSIPSSDSIHLTTPGYDTLGGIAATYFIPFVNE